MESVIGQKECNIEYIIKDGNSQDATNKIVSQVVKRHPDVKIRHLVSEDTGIYDAMNQALEVAEGEWIIYMNAGDVFYNNSVLRDVGRYMEICESAIVYGHTLLKISKDYSFVQIHGTRQMEEVFTLGHQSCFVKRQLLQKYRFNSQYKVAGDYDLFLRMYHDGTVFNQINMVISIYNREGISAQKSDQVFWENIQAKYGMVDRTQYKGLLLMWRAKRFLAGIFPFWEKYRFCKNAMRRNTDFEIGREKAG